MPIPAAVTAKSLLRPPGRAEVFLERERHANVRKGDLSYPVRGVRTRDRNLSHVMLDGLDDALPLGRVATARLRAALSARPRIAPG